MSKIEDVFEALLEHNEAQDGVDLAQTCLITSLIAALRDKGVLTRSEVGAVFDVALQGAEGPSPQSAAVTGRARQVLEAIAGEMAGPPKAQV